MNCQHEFVGKGFEEQGERGNHVFPNELSYCLKAAQYVESNELGFLEAYRNGELRLELCFRSIDHEIDGNFSENLPIAYGFSGLIGAEHATTCGIDESPDERTIQRREREHVVLVSIGKLVEVEQRMSPPSFGLHLIWLEPIYGPNSPLVDSIEPPLVHGLGERFRVGADREHALKGGAMAIFPHQFVNDVVQRGSKVMDNIASYSGELGGRLLENLESKCSPCAVARINIGHYRSVRSTVQVKRGFGLEPVKVMVCVRLPRFCRAASFLVNRTFRV